MSDRPTLRRHHLDHRAGEPAVFWWWDDALREATSRGALTRRKHRVQGFAGMWRISPAIEVEEVCS